MAVNLIGVVSQDGRKLILIQTGGFENGDASAYNGTQIVSRSLSLKSPVIFVSFNYRLNGPLFPCQTPG